jgi:hypothetical protein
LIVLLLFFVFSPFFVTGISGHEEQPWSRRGGGTAVCRRDGSFRISSSFDLQNLPVNVFIGLLGARFQIGRNRALQVRSPVGAILRFTQT